MSENEIRSVVLFFYLAFLDEAVATEAASKAVAIAVEKKRRKPAAFDAAALIGCMDGVLRSYARFLAVREVPSGPSPWTPPQGLDFEAWREFRRSAPSEELLAVLLLSVLGFQDQDAVKALRLPAGTLRYRLGRGLSRLGSTVGPAPLRAV